MLRRLDGSIGMFRKSHRPSSWFGNCIGIGIHNGNKNRSTLLSYDNGLGLTISRGIDGLNILWYDHFILHENSIDFLFDTIITSIVDWFMAHCNIEFYNKICK